MLPGGGGVKETDKQLHLQNVYSSASTRGEEGRQRVKLLGAPHSFTQGGPFLLQRKQSLLSCQPVNNAPSESCGGRLGWLVTYLTERKHASARVISIDFTAHVRMVHGETSSPHLTRPLLTNHRDGSVNTFTVAQQRVVARLPENAVLFTGSGCVNGRAGDRFPQR